MAEKKYTRGRTARIVQYFYEREGVDITIQQLEKQFPEYHHHSIVASLNYLLNGRSGRDNTMKAPIVKVTSGVWRLESAKSSEQNLPLGPKVKIMSFDQMTVTIIKEVDNEMVVVDDNTNIYRMVRL